VFESGIASHEDVVAALAAGASAILVGETLMRAADPAAAIGSMIRGPELAGRQTGAGEEIA
jgi:indole-3-glycerol phosphate synthase